MSNLNAS